MHSHLQNAPDFLWRQTTVWLKRTKHGRCEYTLKFLFSASSWFILCNRNPHNNQLYSTQLTTSSKEINNRHQKPPVQIFSSQWFQCEKLIFGRLISGDRRQEEKSIFNYSIVSQRNGYAAGTVSTTFIICFSWWYRNQLNRSHYQKLQTQTEESSEMVQQSNQYCWNNAFIFLSYRYRIFQTVMLR